MLSLSARGFCTFYSRGVAKDSAFLSVGFRATAYASQFELRIVLGDPILHELPVFIQFLSQKFRF